MSKELPFCQCGCGGNVSKPQNKFILGHNQKSTDKTEHRWKPGQSGNPAGCPTGSRQKITVNCERLLQRSAGQLTERLIEAALDNNMSALKICVERLIPVRKSSPIRIKGMPKVDSLQSASKATAHILNAVVNGEVDPVSAEIVSRITDKHIRSLQISDLEKRLQDLEEKLSEPLA